MACAASGAPQSATPASPDDAILLQCASEQGWRGLIDALERVHPPGTDDARAAIVRARLRIDATDPRKSSRERAQAWTALDQAHARRVAAALDATSREQAVLERATDALRIGFFADPSTASACASADPGDAARALALLRSVEESTRSEPGQGVPATRDRTMAFLNTASQALQVGIDRADRGGAAVRDRRTRAAALLERVRTDRTGIPPALGAVADLAECAAASAAGDADSARAAAVRIVYLGEPLPAMFGRIFVCDALAESRMGDRALAELVQVIRVDGLSLPLRILAADAYVRLRDALGKSSLAAPTFEAYREVINRSGPQERWPARLAVVERLGPITARALDTSWLPPEGLVARAHAQRLAGEAASNAPLLADLSDASPERAAFAAIAALDAAVRTRDDALAADALKALATRFADDPAWSGCALELARLEIAHDAVQPQSRQSQLAASMVLARELVRQPAALAEVAAAQQAVEALALARARSLSPPEAAARLTRILDTCANVDSDALAGTRTLAAILVLDTCAMGHGSPDVRTRPSLPQGLRDVHPSDAQLLGECIAERARDAASSAAVAALAVRLQAVSEVPAAAPHTAAGAREIVAAWLSAPTTPDAATARGLAAVLDSAAAIDPPQLESMRLDVRLATLWGTASPAAAADRTARARAAADHPDASREDLLALADALIDEAELIEPGENATMLAEALSFARRAESLAPPEPHDAFPGPRPIDWGARERMVRVVRLAGHPEQADAHIARLAAIDPTLGGNPGRFSVR